MADRPNFFLLLELDPSLDDWPRIERRIQEKRREWSRDRSQGNPKARRLAEIGLALLPEMESVLRTVEARRQEAQEAFHRRQQEELGQLQELDTAIIVLKTGGGSCNVDQLEKLTKRFATLKPEEIRKRLIAAGVRLANAETLERKPRPVRERIDATVARRIRQNLDHLDLEAFIQPCIPCPWGLF